MSARVRVRNLRKRYGSVQAVRDVSFSIGEGEIFGLLGPNGAGKTTVVESVIGLCEPDSGEIEICGIDARRRRAEVKQRIGTVLQETALQDKITPREALKSFGAMYRVRTAPEELIERFALQEKADAYFETLSGGQKQRLALALAFLNKPDVVFLDEPTAGLDPQARRDLHSRIAEMRESGHSLLLTTHYIEEAERLCDRIAIIDHGQIIAEGTPAELTGGSKSATTVTLRTTAPIAPDVLEAIPGVSGASRDGASARFTTTSVNATLAALTGALGGNEIVDLQVRRATLEDVIIELTGAGLRE